MKTDAYEFSPQQRHTLDRYMGFLVVLFPTYDKVPLVFARREKSGHRRAALAFDARLNQVVFTQRMLRDYGARTERARLMCSAFVDDLLTFTHEALEITRQTSSSKRLDQVDCRLFSFARDPLWTSPPGKVIDMVQALGGRCWELKGTIQHMKDPIQTIYQNSFGFKSAFIHALDHRSCECHPQATVVQELFREVATTPVWDIAYSSADPVIRAGEYKSDIAALFAELSSLYTQMGVFIEAIFYRIDGATKELFQTNEITTLGRLNSKLSMTVEIAEEFSAMINHIDAWIDE